MNKNLILAVFSRDYSWINDLNVDIKKTIYNKNEKTIKENEILMKPNVGRCVHTFFSHIYNNYENLDDYIITSQDFPFDHINNYIEIINGDESTWDKYTKQKIGKCWFFSTEYPLLTSEMNGAPHHVGLDIPTIWVQLFNEPIPTKVEFTPSGHFVASKEQILKRPKHFYEKICNILETDNQSPWVIERLESYIFNENIKIK